MLAEMLFPEQIELLESFKSYKISSMISDFSTKIVTALKSPNFNPLLAHYFTSINPTGQPFTHFARDPDNVSQIKKVLNALYYAQIAFSDLERANFKKDDFTTAAELYFLYHKTVNDAYEASYLLTHLDVDIQELFQDELQLLIPAMGALQTLAAQSSKSTQNFTDSFKNYSLGYNIGEATGTAIEQMKPSSGNLDYAFLTNFSATLPSYIDKVTQYIQQYSSQLIAQEPALNNQKIEELHRTALELLNDLEHLKGGGSLFVSLKFLKYIHIIRNIISLTVGAVEQIGNLSESSQDVIRDKLAQLKYKLLPQLFGLVDKIEVNSMLKPGTLSIPLMDKVKPMYDTLIFYAAKPVNFKAKGEELLSIEDSRFLALRLEKTYQRIDKATQELFKLEKVVEEAYRSFYALLNNPQYKNLSLHQLPAETIAQLTQHYKLLKPFMAHIAPDLDKQLTEALINPAKPGMLMRMWQSYTGALPSDHISLVVEKQQALSEYIEKKKNTQQSNIDINNDLIKQVQQETNLALFAYSDTTSVITTEQIESIAPVFLTNQQEIKWYIQDEEVILKGLGYYSERIRFVSNNQNKNVRNPEQLNAEQSLALYQSYKEKVQLLTEAKNAYKKFQFSLEKSSALDEQQLSVLREQYKKFRPCFSQGAGAEMLGLLEHFDLCFNDAANKVSIPDASIRSQFNALSRHFQSFFSSLEDRWSQRRQFYLQQTKHKYASEEQNVFLIDELRVLRGAKALNSTLQFVHDEEGRKAADPQLLSAEQALILAQWYNKQRAKFSAAGENYIQFITLLKQHTQQHALPDGAQISLNTLNKEVKSECRKLYSLFQPYFVNGFAERKAEHLIFDRYLANAFAEGNEVQNTLTVDMLEQVNEQIQVEFTKKDLRWKKKSDHYKRIAQNKYISENEQQQLLHAPNALRAHYLIKHTTYSKFIYEFRQSLAEVTSLFNNAMQAELKIKKTSGVPFPEVEKPLQTAMQSQQVLAIKQIYNSLYHIEHIVRQLENLNDKAFKTEYVIYLIFTYQHLHAINKLTQQLRNDSHLQLISNELLEKAQNIWATIQEHLEPYQESVNEVAPLDRNVQYSGLWYTLNAFNVIPKHITSLRNTSCLTQNDLVGLHESAKKASLTIEQLINNSHSYFKLFLQTPNMISLYREFKGRLAEFINTLHDTASSNIGEFHRHVFTPMLIEADNWEDKLSLIPGTFSAPLREIINEYYKGLLQPLKLHSKAHIAFICDKTPVKERIARTEQNNIEAQAHLSKLQRNYDGVLNLYQLIEQYNQLTSSFFPPEQSKVSALTTDLIAAYKIALPKLVSLKRVLNYSPNTLTEQDKQFDAHLNSTLKEYEQHLSGIRELVSLSTHYCIGLQRTYEMKLHTGKEKLIYLNQLSVQQEEENARYIVDYTKASFDRQCDELASRHLGLQYVDNEYKAQLKAFLLGFKEEIIAKTKTQYDINQSVRVSLKEKIQLFEQSHFATYYQLDRIRVALAQFKNYFSFSTHAIENNRSLFENTETLAEKTAVINKLIATTEKISLTGEYLSPEERISKIKKEIQDPSFARIILGQKKVEHFSFEYLALCFLSLLEALHLYTPAKTAGLKDLQKAVNDEVKIAELTTRFGLFTTAKTGEPVEKPEGDLEAPAKPSVMFNAGG